MNQGQHVGLLAAVFGLGAALVLVPVFRRLALQIGIVDKPDRPGGRKTQKQAMPLFGGVAVTLAAVLAALAVWRLHPQGSAISFDGYGRVLFAGLLIFLLGLTDDVFKDSFGPLPKFLGQVVAVAVLFGPNYADVFAGRQPWFGILFQVAVTVWFLTVVNAVNFVDNMDGLCGGLAMISLLVGLCGLAGTDGRTALVAGALGGALLGFLPYNFPAARVYLGDAGSHVAGYFLALLSLEFTSGFFGKGARLFGLDAFVPAILLLGVPLFDILFSVVRRFRERRPLFHGDARHLSHRLVGAGLDRTSAVLLLWGVHLILAAAGVVALAQGAAGRYATLAVVLLFLGVLSAILVRVEKARVARTGAAAPHAAIGSNGTNGEARNGQEAAAASQVEVPEARTRGPS